MPSSIHSFIHSSSGSLFLTRRFCPLVCVCVCVSGFLCEQTIPGSVPMLDGVVKPYAGEVMAPFEANF